jgi:cysteinyl-tRNA synthetase
MKIINFLLALVLILCLSCGDDETDENVDYKQEMRIFVEGISEYAKGINDDFVIIPQNGQELVTDNGDTDGEPDVAYLNSIDGVGREDLFFGYDDDDQETPKADKDYMMVFLDICEDAGVEVLVTDYCYSHQKMEESYVKNQAKGYISFAAPDRELGVIPDYPDEPNNVSAYDIGFLDAARNFLYLLNPGNYTSKNEFIAALSETDYDLLIIDYFFEDEEYSVSEINTLKLKNNGGRRLVVSYMSIGEAEDYRYYWHSDWENHPPSWLAGENPEWEGNYKVRYWKQEWKNIIYGSDDSYLGRIISKGFDGVYLDIIDAFEYFEE